MNEALRALELSGSKIAASTVRRIDAFVGSEAVSPDAVLMSDVSGSTSRASM